MARLRSLPHRLATLPPRIGSLPRDDAERSRDRDRFNPWRAWYKTARWQKLRWATLVRDLFTCQRCGRLEGDTSQLVADHRKPHRGDPALFWDADNLEALCKPCHDSAKQREENAARRPTR